MQHASAVAWGAGNMLIIHAPIVVRQVNEGLPFFFSVHNILFFDFRNGFGMGGLHVLIRFSIVLQYFNFFSLKAFGKNAQHTLFCK